MEKTTHRLREILYYQIGEYIKDAREKKGLTQEELANACSLSRTSITNIEKGRQHLPLHTLYKIAFALNKEVSDLLPDLKLQEKEDLVEKIPDDLAIAEREWIEAIVSDIEKR